MNQDKIPLVTAVIPVYNHERFVSESIRSILDQTYSKIELIVINDGSRDHSHDVVLSHAEECKNRFVHFEYINRENRGLSATLNQALGMAKGKYFSALASDDIALPHKFDHLVGALESSDDGAAGAFGDASFIDARGRKAYSNAAGDILQVESDKFCGSYLELHTRERKFDWETGPFGSYKGLLFANYLPAMSCVLKTTYLKEIGGWTVGNVLEDWEMWLQLSKRHKLLFVDETTALYRIHGNNSYDTMRNEFLQSARMLIEREKEYCSRNGLMHEWKDSCNRQLYGFLRYGYLPLPEKIREWKSANALSFIAYLLKALKSRILRKFLRKTHDAFRVLDRGHGSGKDCDRNRSDMAE